MQNAATVKIDLPPQPPQIMTSTTLFYKAKSFISTSGLDLTDDEINANLSYILEMQNQREFCKTCKGPQDCPSAGYYPSLKRSFYGVIVPKVVECKRSYETNRQERIARLVASAKVPKNFKNQTFNTYKKTIGNAKALEFAQKMVSESESKGLVLTGGVGVGKTHLAAAILNHRLKEQKEGLFCVVPELLADIKRTFGTDRDTSELIEIVKNTELLVLDDLGAERPSDWVAEQLYVILNARYQEKKQTVITTNYLSPAELITRIGGVPGQRIVSRLCQMCHWVKIDGPDQRIQPEE